MADQEAGYEEGSNQKHPKIKYEGTYPNLHVTQGADGSQIIRSLEPGKEAVFHIEPSGSYEGHGPDGQKVSVSVGKEHSYNAEGTSTTTDGHSDSKTGGSARTNTDGGSSSETGGNQFSGGGGLSVNGTKGSQINSATSGDSFETTEGNIVTDHTGHVNHNITGDCVSQVTGHKMDMITGEYGIHVSGGNMDIAVDGGDYKVESPTKILFVVGKSSILIEPAKITITSHAVEFVKG
jgi:hypothetical protein